MIKMYSTEVTSLKLLSVIELRFGGNHASMQKPSSWDVIRYCVSETFLTVGY